MGASINKIEIQNNRKIKASKSENWFFGEKKEIKIDTFS